MRRIICSSVPATSEEYDSPVQNDQVFYFTLKDVLSLIASLQSATGQSIKVKSNNGRLMFSVDNAYAPSTATDKDLTEDNAVPCL